MHLPENPFEAKVGSQILNLRDPGLADRLFAALQKSYHMQNRPNKCFLSNTELKEIFSEIVVWHILWQQDVGGDSEEQLGDIVSHILSSEESRTSIQIFTILNLIGEVGYIMKFLDAEFQDNDLPLIRGSEAYNRLLLSGCRVHDLIFFCSQQWHVLVPIFDLTSDTVRRQKFMAQARMPFVEQELRSRGGQGKIWKVKIHANHVREKSSVSEY